MNRFALTIVLLVSITSLFGCATLEVPYDPPGHACGWDPVFGSCDTCGTCGGDCEGHTPASYLGHQLRCTTGCGELYWGPWLSDPPDHCDPCDDCGQFVGDRCCEPKLRQRFWWAITGQSGAAAHGKGCTSCGGKGGCNSCGAEGCHPSRRRIYGAYGGKGCGTCGGKGCDTCGGGISEPLYEESYGPAVPLNEAPVPESLPEGRREVETPASIRSRSGNSLSLPFPIRSTRYSE